MKAVGMVQCVTCRMVLRGYPPRGWKPGGQLCAWRHGVSQQQPCPGSYKAGTHTRLDKVPDLVGAARTEGLLNTLAGVAGKKRVRR